MEILGRCALSVPTDGDMCTNREIYKQILLRMRHTNRHRHRHTAQAAVHTCNVCHIALLKIQTVAIHILQKTN